MIRVGSFLYIFSDDNCKYIRVVTQTSILFIRRLFNDERGAYSIRRFTDLLYPIAETLVYVRSFVNG